MRRPAIEPVVDARARSRGQVDSACSRPGREQPSAAAEPSESGVDRSRLDGSTPARSRSLGAGSGQSGRQSGASRATGADWARGPSAVGSPVREWEEMMGIAQKVVAKFQRRGPLAGPVVLRQGPGQPDRRPGPARSSPGCAGPPSTGCGCGSAASSCWPRAPARTSARRGSRASTSGRRCCWPTARGLLQSAAEPSRCSWSPSRRAAPRRSRGGDGAGARADEPAPGRGPAAGGWTWAASACPGCPVACPAAGARRNARPGPGPRGHAAARRRALGADRGSPAPRPPGPPAGQGPAGHEPGRGPRRRQAGQPQRQAAAGLRARRAGHADAEPGGHRPGPPPAQADRRVGAAQALVVCAPRRPRSSTTPRTAMLLALLDEAPDRRRAAAGGVGHVARWRRPRRSLNGTALPRRPSDCGGTRRFVLRKRPGGAGRAAGPDAAGSGCERTEGEDDPPTMRWDDGQPWRFCLDIRTELGGKRWAWRGALRRGERPHGPGRAAGPPARPAGPGRRPRRPVRRPGRHALDRSGSATRRRSPSSSPSRT